MPTLTGLSLEEFRRAAESWPKLLPDAPQTSMLAALGAVRELWAAEREVTTLLGMNSDEVLPLIEILASGVDDAV
jgi:hypothetical protein